MVYEGSGDGKPKYVISIQPKCISYTLIISCHCHIKIKLKNEQINLVM